MIRLFRKIRHKLLSENNYSIYILYAAGEIVLVMIGILLALQIDNWNEDRKNREIELKALKDLRIEFLMNQEKIETAVYEKKQALKSTKKFLESIRLNNINTSTIIRSYGTNTINPVYGVLNSLLATGRIDFIHNDSLKHLMTSWKDLIQNFREEEERHYNWLDLIVWPYLNEVIPNSDYEKPGGWIYYDSVQVLEYYESAFNSLLFRNYHLENRKALSYVLNQAEEPVKILEEILILIDSEIEKKEN
jgi:hypothetical protein